MASDAQAIECGTVVDLDEDWPQWIVLVAHTIGDPANGVRPCADCQPYHMCPVAVSLSAEVEALMGTPMVNAIV